MIVKIGAYNQSESYSLVHQTLKLHVETIPCALHDACGYFSPAGYGIRIDRLRGDPDRPKHAKAQLFADIVVVVDTTIERLRGAVHICLLPNGDKDKAICPLSIWPLGLLTARERGQIGL